MVICLQFIFEICRPSENDRKYYQKRFLCYSQRVVIVIIPICIIANMIKILLKSHWRFSYIKAPTISIGRYLMQQAGWEKDCEEVAHALHKYGLLYVKDERFNAAQNEEFLDLMERYYATRSYQFDKGMKDIDVVDSAMPIGLQDRYNENFVSYQEKQYYLKPPHQSFTPDKPQPDPTWRFHHVLNSPRNVQPKDFPQLGKVINSWGQNLKNCGMVIAQMAALGLGLNKHDLSDTIVNGDFYMSPTGIDLLKTTPGQLLTAFHRDTSLLTIHGKARYAGLYAWLNTGEKFLVQVPEGHLLVQAGKQLEWLTGGFIKAGFHEVYHNQLVEAAKQRAIRQGKWPWRICSTLFCQVEGKSSIKPLPRFHKDQVSQQYPDITADQFLLQQLRLVTGSGK